MAGGLTVSVRQIASYPLAVPTANDLVLVQSAGLGGPYSSIGVGTLISQGLASGPAMGIGHIPPADSDGASIFLDEHSYPDAGRLLWNAYVDNQGVLRQWTSGTPGQLVYSGVAGFSFQTAGAVAGGSALGNFAELFGITAAGAAVLPFGTLSVARDPAGALEVATMGWVGRSTVASFNGRRGVVTLDNCDIGQALGYPTECIATIPQVTEIVCQAIQDLIHTYPAVWSWNGRVGDVWLTLQDINNVLATAGAPIIVPTPPSDANDGEAVNAGWVINYVTTLLAGPPAYATEAWVTQQIAAINLGVTSFNGRSGAVTLSYIDVAALGFAPVNSPSFSGVPTAPTAAAGNASAQLATTAFVMAAVTAATTGVISWQGRTGAVTMTLADVTSVGGAPNASPNLTGVPAAPTAAQGTSSSQIATTAFVMNEIAASTAGVATFNGRAGNVTLLTADITGAGGAPINAPALTGIPTAPTAANGTNTTQLATTAFVMNEINAVSAGVTSFNGRSGAVTLTANDISAAGGLANPSPALTGTGSTFPTSVTPAPGDNSTNIATTQFVQAALANVGGSYLPLAGGANMTGGFNLYGNATSNLQAVPLQQLTTTLATYAPLASPSLTGTPSAPTASAGTATTQLATTQFVQAALASGLAGYLPLAGGILTGNLTLSNANEIINNGYLSINLGAAASSGSLALNATWNGSSWVYTAAAGALFMGVLGSGGGVLFMAPGAGPAGATFATTVAATFTPSLTTLYQPVQMNGALTTGSTITVPSSAYVSIGGATQMNMNGVSYNSLGSSNNIGFVWTGTACALMIDRSNVGAIQLSGSDATLKENLEAISVDPLAVLDQVQLQQYDWIPTSVQPSRPHVSCGVTAQNIQGLIPEAVNGTPGFLGIDLMLLVSYLIGAVQQLSARVAALDGKAA